jgi:hypothetical protein
VLGKAQWSCCLLENKHARGCIEEHSVGIRSSLGNIKTTFKNYALPFNASSFYHGEDSMFVTNKSKTVPALRPRSGHPTCHSHSLTKSSLFSSDRHQEKAFISRKPVFPTLNDYDHDDDEGLNWNSSSIVLSKRSIGKVRRGSSAKLSGNRPMTSPSGYQSYQSLTYR